jgi:hypothetical protein
MKARTSVLTCAQWALCPVALYNFKLLHGGFRKVFLLKKKGGG